MKGRTTMIRPAPWPLYDTEKVARWLEKMARQGFVLTEHGFPGTLPLAIFQKTNRQNLRYCLVGTVSNAYTPEQETIAWNEARGWTYVARYGDYYVYRSEELLIEDLETAPAVLDTLISRWGIAGGIIGLILFLMLTATVSSLRDFLQCDALLAFAMMVGVPVYAWFAARYLKGRRESQE